jgi:exosome complex RNA-binding protein Rrp4
MAATRRSSKPTIAMEIPSASSFRTPGEPSKTQKTILSTNGRFARLNGEYSTVSGCFSMQNVD